MHSEWVQNVMEWRKKEARRLSLARLLMPIRKPPEVNAVMALLEKGIDPKETDDGGRDALMLAAWGGDPKLVEALLPLCDPKDTDHDGRTALMHAVRETRLDCARVLIPASDLSQRAKNGKTALEMLSEGGRNTGSLHRELAFLLSEHGALPESDWGRVAVSAFGDLDFERLALALEHCDVNKLRISNAVESPLLHRAVALKLAFGVRFLLEKGAEANAQDKDGFTSLMIACLVSWSDDCVEALIAASSLEAKTPEGKTALFFAVENQAVDAARALV